MEVKCRLLSGELKGTMSTEVFDTRWIGSVCVLVVDLSGFGLTSPFNQGRKNEKKRPSEGGRKK